MTFSDVSIHITGGVTMQDNIIQEKSFEFAIRVVKVYQVLTSRRKEFVLSKQLLRSGTSMGANVEEAIGARSRADFLAKLSIGYKEARETQFWIRLLSATGYLTEPEQKSLLDDLDQILKILTSIRLTTKERTHS
jgi:four helix bundle protein